MGGKRKAKPDEGCPVCSPPRGRVRFREKNSSNAQTQTNSPQSSSRSQASKTAYDDGSRHALSSAETHGTHDVEWSLTSLQPPSGCPICHLHVNPPPLDCDTKIYLHLDLKNAANPMLLVCPNRNQSPYRPEEAVIDVDPSESRSWNLRSHGPVAFTSQAQEQPSARRNEDQSHSQLSATPAHTSRGINTSREISDCHRFHTTPASDPHPRDDQRDGSHPHSSSRRHESNPQGNGMSIYDSLWDDHRDNPQLYSLPQHSPNQAHRPPSSSACGNGGVPIFGEGDGQKILSEETMNRTSESPGLHPIVRPSLQANSIDSRSPRTTKKESSFSRVGWRGSFKKTKGVVVSWEALTVTSRDGKKLLLNNLNGQVTSGFTAIMGPSGSGKSTLLNTLACRMDQSATISGRILLNGRDYTNADLKKMSGYVMQDDLLNAHLTVEETLKYTTKLKLEPSLTEVQVMQRVNDVIKQMGLNHGRKTVIGSPEKRGISGGERKRVCVGMELLTNPQLLFLDEPTSGLDSVTALSLCEQLRKLADSGNCTIICTIHQPQAKIFNLFHYLIILKAGQVIYQGKASRVLKFFEDSGFPCPGYTNPADHLLDVITPSIYKPRDSLKAVDDVLKANFIHRPVNMSRGSEIQIQTLRNRMPWHRQYLVLLNRGVKEQNRKKSVLLTQLLQSLIMALLIGGVFFQIGSSEKSTVRRQPVLFFCVINQGVFGALSVINSFPGERALTLRERAAGMYYCSAYFMAKITAEMVAQVISPIIFSCVVYWMVGFQKSAAKFFIFMCFMVLCQLAATSLALMTSALCRTTDLSVTVLPMALEVNRLFGGFFLSPKNLPTYFEWLDALSYVKYTYTAISLNELRGLTITCAPTDLVNGECPITSGQQTIDSLGLGYLQIGSCAGILIFYILLTRLFAYLGIRYLKT